MNHNDHNQRLAKTTDKYKNKYRIASARLPNWDYGSNGAYFVTICTRDRVHYFGKIKNGIMCLSEIGQIAQDCWYTIPDHFPFVVLDAFVIMPNHVHGIVIINGNHNHDNAHVEKLNSTSLPRISPKSGSLPTIIRSYKSVVTKQSRYNDSTFHWQPRFYDHIIRNDQDYQRIAAYIHNNPRKWELDRNNVQS